ncbi:MAG: polysaccharide biosynthesis C-terminal domain-containing protein [Lachnospiraceae bacterium]
MEKKGKQGNHHNKPMRILAVTGVLLQLVAILTSIPLTNMIGDAGNGFLAAAYGVYLVLLVVSTYVVPNVIADFMRTRITKGQYKNAVAVLRTVTFYAAISGLLAGAIAYFGADFLMGNCLLEPMSALILQALSPTLVIMAFVHVLRGYFQGIGTMMPTMISQIIERIVTSVSALAATFVLAQYGSKVGSLLGNASFLSSYGAMGIACGMGIGAIISLLFLLVVWGSYHKSFQHQVEKDVVSTHTSYAQLMRLFFVAMLPLVVGTLVAQIEMLLDQILYHYSCVAQGMNDLKAVQFGVYVGKYKVLTGIPILLGSLICVTVAPMLRSVMGKVTIKVVKDRITSLLHVTMLLVIPLAVGLMVLAEPIVTLLFQGEIELAAQMLRMGSVSVILWTLCIFSTGVLQGLHKEKIVLWNTLVGLALHSFVLVILFSQLPVLIYAVVIADMLFALILYALNQWFISKTINYKQELIQTFLFPAGASIVMGLMMFLLHKGLIAPLGNLFATLIAMVVGFIVYLVLITLLHGFEENEIILIPGGSVLIIVAKWLHVLR